MNSANFAIGVYMQIVFRLLLGLSTILIFESQGLAKRNQNQKFLSCYKHLKYFHHKSPSKFFDYKRTGILGTDLTKSILGKNPGYLTVLPSNNPPNSNNRGFFVMSNDGIFWHKFDRTPKKDGKIVQHYLDLKIPGIVKKIYVGYPDFISKDGSEYGNLNIGISHKKYRGKKYKPVALGQSQSPETVQLFHNDLIRRINDVPRVFRRHQELAKGRRDRGEPVGSLGTELEFVGALEACKENLDSNKHKEVIKAVEDAIEQIKPSSQDDGGQDSENSESSSTG